MNKLLTILTSLFSLCSLGAFYPEDPVKYQQQIEKHVKRIIDRKNPDIFFMGDDHQKDDAKIYGDLFKEILVQDSKVDCLFLEMPTGFFQGAIDEYLSSGDFSVIEKNSARVHKLYNSKENPVALKEKKVLIDIAKKHGVKVYAIDKLPSPTTVLVMTDMINDFYANPSEAKAKFFREFQIYHYGYVRNEFIAKEMASLFQKNHCAGAVAVNGNSHLQNNGMLPHFNVLAEALQLILSKVYGLKFGKLVI